MPTSNYSTNILVACLLASSVVTSLLPLAANAADSAWTLQSFADSPENWKLSGSFRSRYELLDGQPRPGLDESPDLLSFRTTLAAEYMAGAFRFAAEIYDSRAYWGDARTGIGTGEVNALEVVQAYVGADLRNVFATDSNASLKAGRFMLNLGSRRLVAADDYRNTTNSYTGLRVDLNRKAGPSSTFIYTLPQRRLPDDLSSLLDNDIERDSESSALVLWGGMVTWPKLIGGESLETSFFRLNEDDEPDLATRNRRLNTTSVRLFRDPLGGAWDYEIEAAYQSGSVRAGTAANAAALDVSAYFYHAEIGYQGTGAWKPRVSVEYDEVSGDDSASDYGRFDTLFGMRRADFAPSGIFAAVARANIRSPGIRVDFVPSARLDAFIGYRGLWLDSRTDSFSTTNVRDASGRSGDFAGHQIDMRARYWLLPKLLRFEGNAVLLFKGRFLKDAPNAPATGDTRYLSANLIATF